MISDSYIKKISYVPKEKCLLLALCYVERHQCVVKKFDEYYNETLYKYFINKLENAYNMVFDELAGAQYVQDSLRELKKIMPDSEDYPETLGTLALNGFIMLYYSYQFMLTSQSEDIINILNLALETMDAIKYEIVDNYNYENECQEEFILLDKYLEILNDCQNIDKRMVNTLRELTSKNMFANPVM